jgi:membrane protein insertase Oxa1/YidC/SpoIIIJ
MMPYMSLVMILLFYRFPSGLNLYIMTSSLFGTLEQWYIRKHVKKQDLQPRPRPAPAKPKQPGAIASYFKKLEKQVEQAQKIRSRRAQKRQ